MESHLWVTRSSSCSVRASLTDGQNGLLVEIWAVKAGNEIARVTFFRCGQIQKLSPFWALASHSLLLLFHIWSFHLFQDGSLNVELLRRLRKLWARLLRRQLLHSGSLATNWAVDGGEDLGAHHVFITAIRACFNSPFLYHLNLLLNLLRNIVIFFKLILTHATSRCAIQIEVWANAFMG